MTRSAPDGGALIFLFDQDRNCGQFDAPPYHG